jgi:threonyl-tRNA synthetase
VVGEKEKENQTVNVRSRDNLQLGEFAVTDLIAKFRTLKAEFTPTNEL